MSTTAPPRHLELAGERLLEIRSGWLARYDHPPSPAEMEQLVEEAIIDEILYREALARNFDDSAAVRDRLLKLADHLELISQDADSEQRLRAARAMGLDRSDPLVRRYLASAMRERISAGIRIPEPTRDEIDASIKAEPERFRRAERLRLSHVYVGGPGREEWLRAELLAERIGSQNLAPSQAIPLGDAFYGGHRLPWLTPDELTRRFGRAFGDRVSSLATGTWSEPIASSYGHHIVRIDERAPGGLPLPSEIESQVRRELVRERTQVALEREIRELRDVYEVVLPAAGTSRTPDVASWVPRAKEQDGPALGQPRLAKEHPE